MEQVVIEPGLLDRLAIDLRTIELTDEEILADLTYPYSSDDLRAVDE